MARIAVAVALTAALVASTAHAAAGDAVASDLGDGTAQVYVEQPDGSYLPDGDPFIITPPAPAPMPVVVGFPQGADVTPLIYPAAARWGTSAPYMVKIARCESSLGTNPLTYQPWRTHRGPFQFNRITWEEQAPRYGLSGNWDTALDPWSNVELAAALLAHGQSWRWTCA